MVLKYFAVFVFEVFVVAFEVFVFQTPQCVYHIDLIECMVLSLKVDANSSGEITFNFNRLNSSATTAIMQPNYSEYCNLINVSSGDESQYEEDENFQAVILESVAHQADDLSNK